MQSKSTYRCHFVFVCSPWCLAARYPPTTTWGGRDPACAGQAPSSQAGMGTPHAHPCSSRCPGRASGLLVQPLVSMQRWAGQKATRLQEGKWKTGLGRLKPSRWPTQLKGCPFQVHQSMVVLGRNAAAVRMLLFCKSIFRTFQSQLSRRANAKCISPSSRSCGASGAIEFHSFHLYYKYCIVVSFFSLILSLEKNYKALVDWSLWLSTVVKPQAVNTSFNCLRRTYLFHWNNWMKSVRAKESPLSRQLHFSTSELNAKETPKPAVWNQPTFGLAPTLSLVFCASRIIPASKDSPPTCK